jgi:hypothetical protein
MIPSSRAWRDSGVADEVEACLAGRLVEHLTATRQPVPAWAVLNRLAHADRSELVRFVEGANVDPASEPRRQVPSAVTTWSGRPGSTGGTPVG